MVSDGGPEIPSVEDVRTRMDLAKFLDQLAKCSSESNWWDNRDLSSYLTGAAGYVHDLDGAFHNRGETFDENQNYKLIARIFLAATAYE